MTRMIRWASLLDLGSAPVPPDVGQKEIKKNLKINEKDLEQILLHKQLLHILDYKKFPRDLTCYSEFMPVDQPGYFFQPRPTVPL